MKEYLHDSVYIDNDGFQLILTTENGSLIPSNKIYVDNIVLSGILTYAIKNEIIKLEGLENFIKYQKENLK